MNLCSRPEGLVAYNLSGKFKQNQGFRTQLRTSFVPPLRHRPGLIGALVGDTVFGFAGVHVSLAKMACCSCLGVCWYYIQQSFFVPRSYQSSSSLVGDSNQGSGELLRSKATALPALAGVVVPSVLAVLYCAGLFSNSFIEVRDEYSWKVSGWIILSH